MAERTSARRVAGVLTGGLFVKTLMAVAFPFAVAAASAVGGWPLSLFPFAALALLGVCRMPRPPQPVAGARRSSERRSPWRVVRDPVAVVAAAAFAVAIVADVLFNLSIPELVVRRFGRGDATAAVAYAVLFGVKLPVTPLGAWAKAVGGRAPEVSVLALVALLAPLAAFVTFSRNKA